MRTDTGIPWLLVLLVFVLAVTVRLVFAASPSFDLNPNQLDADSPSFYEQATRLAEDRDFMSAEWTGPGPNHGKVVPSAFRAPLWIAVQAVPYTVTGADPTVGRLLNIILDAAACGLLVILGTRLAGRQVGLVAGLFGATYAQFVVSTRQLMSEPLVLLLIVLLLLVFDRYLERPTTARAVGVGAMLGLIALARANGLVVAFGLGIWLLWRGRAHFGVAVRGLVPMALATLVVIAPYVAYASVRMDAFVPVTVQTGTILAGDFTDTVADRSNPRWGWWDIAPLLTIHVKAEDEIEQDREGRAIARDWITNHPADTAKIIGLRTIRYFDLYWEIDNRVATRQLGTRRSLTEATVLQWWILAPLGILGVFQLKRRRDLDRWMPGVVVFVAFAAMGVAFGGASRYRVPGEPVVLLLAAAAVVMTYASLRQRFATPAGGADAHRAEIVEENHADT